MRKIHICRSSNVQVVEVSDFRGNEGLHDRRLYPLQTSPFNHVSHNKMAMLQLTFSALPE
jgi:hypothetical protein